MHLKHTVIKAMNLKQKIRMVIMVGDNVKLAPEKMPNLIVKQETIDDEKKDMDILEKLVR